MSRENGQESVVAGQGRLRFFVRSGTMFVVIQAYVPDTRTRVYGIFVRLWLH